MKNIKILGIMICTVISIMLIEACSKDNSSEEISYTADEIVKILTGKWEIYGHVSVSGDASQKVESDYNGTIEFKADQKYEAKSTVISTGGINNINGETYTWDEDIYDYLGSAYYYKYSILRKNGMYYIQFGSSSNPKTFRIVSLTEKSFKLVRDEDEAWGSPEELHYAHYNITINSK